MANAKQFKTYAQQLELLEQRGMTIEDPASAEALLRQLNSHESNSQFAHFSDTNLV